MDRFVRLSSYAFLGLTLLSLSPLKMLSPSVDDLPPGVRTYKAGRYTLAVKPENPFRAKEGIEAELVIPSGVTGPVPLMVFIHGNSRDKKYFKRAANFITAANPQPKKVMVLSVQNWWPLSGDHLDATEDTRRAVNLLVNKLAHAGVVQPDKVFLSGFSAGGWIAVVTLLQSLDLYRDENYRQKFAVARAQQIEASKKSAEDYYYTVEHPGRETGFYPYAGMIFIKGNFYAKYFIADSVVTPEEFRELTGKLLANKKVILTVGGDGEAKDVKYEVPACREFLKRVWGAKLDYHEYGDDVHDITKTDQEHLWASLADPILPVAPAAAVPAVK